MGFLNTRAADSVETSKYDHSRHAQVISSAQARLPIHFFTIGILSLACVGLAAVMVMPVAVRFFYQPRVLALVHTLTLGVITAVMMGVMYRYVRLCFTGQFRSRVWLIHNCCFSWREWWV